LIIIIIKKIQIKVKNHHHLINQAQNHVAQAEVVVEAEVVAEAHQGHHQGHQEEDVEVEAGHQEEGVDLLKDEEVLHLNQQLYMLLD